MYKVLSFTLNRPICVAPFVHTAGTVSGADCGILFYNIFDVVSEKPNDVVLCVLQFTKDYNNLFSEAGVPPKRKLTRFIVTPNAAVQPGRRVLRVGVGWGWGST